MLYVEGTFWTAPRPYVQYFTIHGQVNDHVLNLTSGSLLADKTTEAYQDVFQKDSNRVLNLKRMNWDNLLNSLSTRKLW